MTAQQKVVLTAVVAAIIGFTIGAVWQYTSARSYADRLDVAETDLAFQQTEATLGAATIEAQRGSYELARQLASDFFSSLQQHVDRAPADQQPAFRDMLEHRDAMITSLSRSDPQSGSMLAQLFVRYRIAMGEPVGPNDTTSTPPAGMQPPADTQPSPDGG
ncbi:hypothetical protein BH23GEM10_BH23GEM10_03610 [soil metagenome]